MYRQGLSNLGNTCFINSIIQCLKNLRPFKEYLLSYSSGGGLTGKFAKLIQNFESGRKDQILEDFISTFYSKTDIFKRYEQDDSHIFLISLLTIMDKETRTSYQSDSKVRQLFSNNIQTITTDNYGKTDKDIEPSFCISLPIINNGKVCYSLEECLKEYQKPKELQDTYSRKTYRECVNIQPLGTFLIFNFQRVSNGRHINNAINFPEYLEFGNYHYELKGLIKHIGDQYSGHKVALCKDLTSCWYEFDDYKVAKLSNQLPNESLVFLLFYQKIDSLNNYCGNEISNYSNKLNETPYNNQNTPNSYNNTPYYSQSNNKTGTITNISQAVDLYKLYEKEKTDRENNFYQEFSKKGMKNETDFLNYNPSNNMKKYEFQKNFGINNIPDMFIENNDIKYFDIIYYYKKYLNDSKPKSLKTSNKQKK